MKYENNKYTSEGVVPMDVDDGSSLEDEGMNFPDNVVYSVDSHGNKHFIDPTVPLSAQNIPSQPDGVKNIVFQPVMKFVDLSDE